MLPLWWLGRNIEFNSEHGSRGRRGNATRRGVRMEPLATGVSSGNGLIELGAETGGGSGVYRRKPRLQTGRPSTGTQNRCENPDVGSVFGGGLWNWPPGQASPPMRRRAFFGADALNSGVDPAIGLVATSGAGRMGGPPRASRAILQNRPPLREWGSSRMCGSGARFRPFR